MPGLPELPINVPYEHQGQHDGDHDPDAEIHQTHSGRPGPKPDAKGTVPLAPMRYREE